LASVGGYLLQQGQDRRLAGERDIDAVETRGLHRCHQVLEAAAGQAVEVHQVVGAADARRRECVLLQRR
jgi:hypothetical protein